MTLEEKTFIEIFRELKHKGKIVFPRGQKVLEIQDFHYDFQPYVRFMNFKERKLNIPYIKKEFLWYLKGDKFDTSIANEASLWKTCINEDGSINSNYGQYIFRNGQFDKAMKCLVDDKDSRRASMVILNENHLFMKTNDICCTYSINFRIRENTLNMSVLMRSQDAIYGLGSDLPCFSFIHEMMFNSLKEKYPNLILGNYHHYANSFHVYEKHFEMFNKITSGESEFASVDCPQISGKDEVDFLIFKSISQTTDKIPPQYKFSEWLTK